MSAGTIPEAQRALQGSGRNRRRRHVWLVLRSPWEATQRPPEGTCASWARPRRLGAAPAASGEHLRHLDLPSQRPDLDLRDSGKPSQGLFGLSRAVSGSPGTSRSLPRAVPRFPRAARSPPVPSREPPGRALEPRDAPRPAWSCAGQVAERRPLVPSEGAYGRGLAARGVPGQLRLPATWADGAPPLRVRGRSRWAGGQKKPLFLRNSRASGCRSLEATSGCV